MQIAILKNSFRDGGCTFGLRGQGHVLRLHVSSKARIFLGRQICRNQFFSATNAQAAGSRVFDGYSGVAQFADDRAQV